MHKVTAKIRLQGKTESNEQVLLTFVADYVRDGKDVNKAWAKYTPALSLSMNVLPEVAEHFEVDKPITLTFELDETENV